MLVHYNKFKSLDNPKNGKFLFGIFLYLNSVYPSILNGLVDYILEFTYLLVLYFLVLKLVFLYILVCYIFVLLFLYIL